MRWWVVALALLAGCNETLASPDFSSVRPLCPPSPPAIGAACDAISEPNCTYPMVGIRCTCVDGAFVCAAAIDLGHTD